MLEAKKIYYALNKISAHTPEKDGQRIIVAIPPEPNFSCIPAKQVEINRFEEIEFVAGYVGEGKARELVWFLST